MKPVSKGKPNAFLRQQRLLRGWSLQHVADELHTLCEQENQAIGVTADMVGKWERGDNKPSLFYQEKLCRLYGLSAAQLGFIDPLMLMHSTEDNESLSAQTSPVDNGSPQQTNNGLDDNIAVTNTASPQDVTREIPETQTSELTQADKQKKLLSVLSQAIIQSILVAAQELEGQDIDILRRQLLQLALEATGTALITPIHKVLNITEPALMRLTRIQHKQIITTAVEEFLPQCRANIVACWHLMKSSEIAVVQYVLATYLPQLERLAQQPSQYQKKFADLTAQGYILAGLVAVLQQNHSEAEWYCKQAIQYSRMVGDYNLEVAALKHLATKYLSAKYPLKTLHTYQEALPLVSHVSPLLRSRTYLGLAIAYAQCGQKQEALRYLGLAQDTFPEYPEEDPSFSYADCGRSSLNHYEGLIYLEFNHPKEAWETFAGVEGLKSKIDVPERTIIEIVNCQAEAAVALRNMELACAHVEVGIAGALRLKSEKRFNDTSSVYKQMRLLWPDERQVKALAELFHR